MTYATRQDLEEAYGVERVALLARQLDDEDGSKAALAISRALAGAAAQIDAAVAVRHPLPLPQPVPLLTQIACDLAVARLASTGDQATDEVHRREDKARADLRAINEGRLNLGLPSVAGERPQPIVSQGQERLFSRQTLRGL